ncbi:MAG: hypothetical protein GY694_01115 [Gammaproteobacteria bacterium]|nr:hypothetical protein [Gammaproteobacteria bacterium]
MVFWSIIYEPKASISYTIGNSLYGIAFKKLLDEKGIEYFPYKEDANGNIFYSIYRKDKHTVKELSQEALSLSANGEGYNFNSECTFHKLERFLEDRNITYFIDKSGRLGSKYTVWTSAVDAKNYNIGGKTLGTEHACLN